MIEKAKNKKLEKAPKPVFTLIRLNINREHWENFSWWNRFRIKLFAFIWGKHILDVEIYEATKVGKAKKNQEI